MKNKRNLGMLLVAVCASSAMIFAQGTKDELRPMKRSHQQTHMPRLGEDQRMAVHEVRGKYAEELKELKFEIAEMQAHQKTLMGNAAPDEKALLNNAASLVKKRGEMSKLMLAMRLETRSVVAPDGEKGMRMKRFHQKGESMKPGNRNAKRHGDGNYRAGERMNDQNRFAQGQEKRRQSRQGVRPEGKVRAGQQGDMAQRMRQNRPNGGAEREPFFSEEQKAAMKELRLSNYQEVTDLKNELNELQVRQQSILAQKEVDVKAANKNIDAMTDLKVELAQLQMKSKLAVKDLLTDEQKARMGQRDLKRQGHGRRLRS